MKKSLRLIALVLAVAALGFWAALGANRGFTKNNREIKTLDPVTGLDGITYEKHFSPGVDFLAVGLAAAAALGGASFLLKNKRP